MLRYMLLGSVLCAGFTGFAIAAPTGTDSTTATMPPGEYNTIPTDRTTVNATKKAHPKKKTDTTKPDTTTTPADAKTTPPPPDQTPTPPPDPTQAAPSPNESQPQPPQTQPMPGQEPSPPPH